MGRGRGVYLSYTALVLLSAVSTSAADSIWHVSIDESPAPPPDKGPPFSANAIRNTAFLPGEVAGIVAAYIGSVVLLTSLLFSVGRKLRRKALNMTSEPTEMIKPLGKTFNRSPTSPGRAWFDPRRLKEKRSTTESMRSINSKGRSPAVESVGSFDTDVVEADRRRGQAEMERLYAAVMAQDEQRNSGPTTTEMPPEYSNRSPPRLKTSDPNMRQFQVAGGPSSGTPMSPVRAIYPPDDPRYADQTARTDAVRPGYHSRSKSSQSDLKTGLDRAPSFGSGLSTTSTVVPSSPKKLRKSIRNIKISNPMPHRADDSDDARTPLSPWTYTDPGVPPEPPSASTAGFSPTTPANEYGWDGRQDVDEVREVPQSNPQRTQPVNAPAVSGALPLREMNRQYMQQQRQYARQPQTAAASSFPLSPGQWNVTSPHAMSAGPTKTTFLETGRDNLSGPRTGLPTPYSPYMPFTPVTPITPHLTSRTERKQREKDQKRHRMPVMDEDAVADDKDMWDSGY